LGLNELWKQRHQLAEMKAADEDRLLGHLLVLSGIVLFPFCRFAIWPQALLWLLVLVGIACSTWGISFFKKYALSALLMVLSVYPRPNEMIKILLETFFPTSSLDHFSAWTGSLALRAIGQPAVANNTFISLPTGSVEVQWGCNGFSMAVNVAVIGLVLGLFLKQKVAKVIKLIMLGAVLAYVLNIPRIVLVTYAAVYWGPYWFNFWHHSWGAQIFVGAMFTVYYYIAMWMIGKPAKKIRT
jgi:exosortase